MIDRRTCQRVVPMQVLVLGLSRTATASLREALFILGYSDVYHMASIMRDNPRDCEMWNEAYRAIFQANGTFEKGDWDQLLGHSMAVSDAACIDFAPQLPEAYSDPKVILTLRDDANAWYESCMETVYPFIQQNFLRRGHFLSAWQWFARPNPLGQAYRTTMTYHAQHGGWADFPTKGKDFYHQHNQRIRDLVKKGNLLEYNAKEGWEPLCKFLGKEVPNKEGFPHVNDRHQFAEDLKQRYPQNMGRVAWFKSLLIISAVGAGLAMIIRVILG